MAEILAAHGRRPLDPHHDDQHDPRHHDLHHDDLHHDDLHHDDLHHDHSPRDACCGAAQRWLAGVDAVVPRPRPAEGEPPAGAAPVGRLHAVDEAGLSSGRALCHAVVVPLDPTVERWPGAADHARPLCWTCLGITHAATDGPSTRRPR